MDQEEKLPEVLITPYQEKPGQMPVPEGESEPVAASMPAQEEKPAESTLAAVIEPAPAATSPVEPPRSVVKPVLGGLTACVACGCIGIPVFIFATLVVLLLVDPFNLHVIGRLNGRYDAAAEMMPEDSGMYMGINIGNALLTHVDRVFAPMLAGNQADESTMLDSLHARLALSNRQQDSIIDEFIQTILADTGINIPEDLSPWIGQYAGVGTFGFQSPEYGAFPGPTKWLIAIEARNLGRADDFLETLEGNLVTLKGMEFSQERYNGRTIYIQQVTGSANSLSFGRTGRMVLIGSDVSLVKNAMDGRGKSSLAQQSDYAVLISQRPRTWSMSMYYTAESYNSLLDAMRGNFGSAYSQLFVATDPTWNSLLMSATINNNSLQIDIYTSMSTASQAGSNQVLQLSNLSVEKVIQLLPQDTVVFLAWPEFDLFKEAMVNAALAGYPDPDFFYASFKEILGFSLTDDFLNHLDGQWTIYAVPSTSGLIAEQADLNLAVGLLVETDNQLDLDMISGKLSMATNDFGIKISTNQQNGINYYEAGESWSNNPMLVFGQSNGFFGVGTDTSVLQTSFTNITPLVSTDNYLQAFHSLPAGMQPTGYVNLEHLFGSLREEMNSDEIQSFNDSIGILENISRVIIANGVIQPNINHGTILIIMTGQ